MKGRSGNIGAVQNAARSPLTYVALGLVVIFCLLLAGGGFLLYGLNRAQPTLPSVTIEEPRRGDELIAGTSSIVYARAADPDGVAKAELWINGQLVASQANAGAGNPFQITQSWRPTDVGAYMLLVRATDTRGYVGQSASLLVNVLAKTPPAVNAVSEVPASAEGGQSSLVPVVDDTPPPSGAASDDGSYPAAGIPEPPTAPPGGAPAVEAVLPPFFRGIGRVCLIVPVLCRSSSGGPSSPPSASDPGSFGMPGWGVDLCRAAPSLPGCPGAVVPGGSLPNAPRVSATYNGACQINVQWSDESDNETGFMVYRFFRTSTADLVARTDSAGVFADHPGAGGTFRYYVSAYNANGESPSAPSEEVIVPRGDCIGDIRRPVTDLEFEALTFTVAETLDRVYCYYALVRPPFVRVPAEDGQFMELSGDSWNIADYAGGANRLHISLPIGLPLTVTGQCLGWRGAEFVDLGEFNNTHLPEEWDGREQTGTSGRFMVKYRIRTPIVETREGPAEAIVDPTIPPPYNVHFQFGVPSCGPLTGSGDVYGRACDDVDALTWNWEPAPGDTRPLFLYRVFFRLAGSHDVGAPSGGFGTMSHSPRQMYYETHDSMAPGAFSYSDPCIINLLNPIPPEDTDVTLNPQDLVIAERVFYSVQAQVADPITGGKVESPVSEETEVSMSGCPRVVAITVFQLTYDLNYAREADRRGGSCDAADVFGIMDVDGTRLGWNSPYRDVAGVPHDSQLGCNGDDTVYFRSVYLNQEAAGRANRGWQSGNNVVLVPIGSDTHDVTVDFSFFDYDSWFNGDDDLWCAGSETFRAADLLSDHTQLVSSTSTDYENMSCALWFSTHVLDVR